MYVSFHHNGIKFTLNNRAELKSFIPKIFREEKKTCESVDIIFCTDYFLLEINRSFLQHDFYTDIITFNLATPRSPVIAELYISVDRVRENAQTLGVSFKAEIHRVIFHGLLHLCGYGDKTKKEQALIRKMEDFYLKKYLSAN